MIFTYTQLCSIYVDERVLYPDVVGKFQNEAALVFWYEEYCNRMCVLNFGCSEICSMMCHICAWPASVTMTCGGLIMEKS